MSAGEVLQLLVGTEVVSVAGTAASYPADECLDFRIVTRKGTLIASATNNEAIAMEWVPST